MNESKKSEQTVETGGKEAFQRRKPVLTAQEIIELSKAAQKAPKASEVPKDEEDSR